MKKLLIPFIVLFITAVSLVSWKSQKITAGGGVSIYPEGCQVIDGSGNIINVGPGESKVTPSGNGKITCKATVSNTTGSAVKWDNANTGYLCFVAGAGLTDSWQNIVSASGQATLQCHFKP